tara:strand:+ start:17650 stop:19470 length:1821 start_codon:yes stop_codon:yes gene_type:complete
MCGIAGVLDYRGDKLYKSDLKRMTNAIAHRGPDGEGFFISKNNSVGLGHRRLSIIDLTDNASQPMTIRDRYTITYNGEIYNYRELKKDLEKKNYIFRSESDTEVLLNCFIEYGYDCLNYFDGMFAFAIWDEVEKKLFCARDRFGEKPFFYTFYNSQFIFASEIKSILKYGFPRIINFKKLSNYLVYNAIDSIGNKNETYYENIFQLEPSKFMVVNFEGKIEKHVKYWNLSYSINNNLTLEESVEVFKNKFNTSIQRRLRSDVAVGSSLSGGLDSSSIVYSIDKFKKSTQKQKTFSARFKNFELDEGVHMNTIIKSIPSIDPHFIFNDSSIIIDEIDNVFNSQESPFLSPGIIVQNQVMKLARENGVKVLLDGQGADEIAAGYFYYYNYFLIEKMRNGLSGFLKSKNDLTKFNPEYKLNSNLWFMFNSFFPVASQKIKEFRIKKTNKFKSLNTDFIKSNFYNKYPYNYKISLNQALEFSVFDIGLVDLLKYADRNSMSNSIEVRLPFLSHDLVEFIFSLDSNFKINNGWTKFIIRKSFENSLPKSIVWRKDKIGYMPPIERWMNNPKVNELVNSSIQNLIKEKVIKYPVQSMHWNYLMVDRLLKYDY